MKLETLLEGVQYIGLTADLSADINGVRCDSRQVMPGDAFIAINGHMANGNQYISMALERGAAVIVTSEKPEGDFPYVLVTDDRMALAVMGANYYGRPAESMTMVGVTGTNGKTSVTWLLEQVLEKTTGEKVGLIGTVENHIGAQVSHSVRTTPQSVELQEMFAKMRDAGCKYVVMEVSSHAIDQERVGGIEFDVAAFTNLTHDHLDYHKTMENYCDVKARLFKHCKKAVINCDDVWYGRVLAQSPEKTLLVSIQKEAELYARDVQLHADGIAFVAVHGAEEVQVSVPIPGRFTVYNVLTVLGCALQLGISLEAAAEALKDVHGVKGRVELVPTPGRDYKLLIDFAHTPDGLESLLRSVRDFCKGRLICVFGANGDRDALKRPLMGKIGVSLSDIAIVTTGDPRSEEPMDIIRQVLQDVEAADNYKVVENRREAIRYAMDIAKKDDIIVLAGKGHGTYQEVKGEKLPFDERLIVKAFLEEVRV